MAAKKANVHADPLCIAYEFVCDEVLEGVSDTLRRETLRMITKEEILQELEKLCARLPPCVQEAELVLLALPIVMGPGAVMSGHIFLNTYST